MEPERADYDDRPRAPPWPRWLEPAAAVGVPVAIFFVVILLVLVLYGGP